MKLETRPRELLENFILLLAPFAPHLAEELWEKTGHTNSLAYESWPTFDPAKTIEDTVEVVIQVNGKVRSKISVANGTAESELQELASKDENVQRHLAGKQLVRAIVVKNKLVNFVIRN
jgi:leucyl-tRNA synthetase